MEVYIREIGRPVWLWKDENISIQYTGYKEYSYKKHFRFPGFDWKCLKIPVYNVSTENR
jgi:hypothetical protein